MKAILQRVTKAKVEVDSKTVGEIGTGFLILLGVENGDTEKEADALAAKIAGLRIFTDENDKMNLNINQVLITCIEENIASRKVIEKCGGVFQNAVENNGKLIRRYMIKI